MDSHSPILSDQKIKQWHWNSNTQMNKAMFADSPVQKANTSRGVHWAVCCRGESVDSTESSGRAGKADQGWRTRPMD